MQCRLRDRRSRLFSLGLRPCPLRTEIPPDSLNLLIMLCTVEGEISKSLPIFLWGTLFLNISIIFSRICWQTGDPRPIFAPKGLDLSWMLLLYQIIITITCWHQLFQITSLFNQFTSLLALNCSCPNFFWNVLQVWMTGKDVYLQMTWSWPDKTWNILCSYCLQWNTSQSKFRNHYFLFLFAFSVLSQLFLIWGCSNNSNNWPNQQIHMILYKRTHTKFYNFYSYCCYWPLPQLSCRLCLYHKVYIKSIVFFINLYKLVLSLPFLTVHDICPHLRVCLSFRVDFYWTYLSKKQESGNASLTSHVTNQIFN